VPASASRGGGIAREAGVDPESEFYHSIDSRAFAEAMSDVGLIKAKTTSDTLVLTPEETVLKEQIRARARAAFRVALSDKLGANAARAGAGNAPGTGRPGAMGAGRSDAGADQGLAGRPAGGSGSAQPDIAASLSESELDEVAAHHDLTPAERQMSALGIMYGDGGPPKKLVTNEKAAHFLGANWKAT
jgi:hypothetical protein